MPAFYGSNDQGGRVHDQTEYSEIVADLGQAFFFAEKKGKVEKSGADIDQKG
jgi:hypothetical protein